VLLSNSQKEQWPRLKNNQWKLNRGVVASAGAAFPRNMSPSSFCANHVLRGGSWGVDPQPRRRATHDASHSRRRRIKALPGMARTAVIAVSSFAMKGDEEKARAAGLRD